MAKLSVDQALLRAKGLARKGQISEARRLCQAVIEAYPNNKRARTALAGLTSQGHPVQDQNPPQESLERLGALLGQGKPEVAAAEAEHLSKSYPNALIVWNLLGAANAEAGQIEQAEAAFRRAVELGPNNAEAHRNLGKILIDREDFGQSVEACKRALQIRPDYLEAYNTLGNALKASGRLEEAVAAYLRVLKVQPNYVEVLYNLGNTLLEMGKSDKATQIYEKALKLQPDFDRASLGLGLSLLSQGRCDEAVAVCKDVIRRNPENTAAHLLLGNALRQDGQPEEALVAVQAALACDPDDAEVHNDLGLTLQALGQFDGAIDAFGKAVEIQPQYVQARKNRGVAFLSLGSVAEAIAEYEHVLATKPDDAEAHRHLSTIKSYDPGDPQIAGMRALLAKGNLTDADRCQIAFALAKACEDIGEFEQAFDHLKVGNALRKADFGYDISDDVAMFTALKAAAGDLRAASRQLDFEEPDIIPVFILGMPRSGTTLVEQIVSAHSAVTGAGELELVERHGAVLATGETSATAENLKAFRDAYLRGIRRLSEGRRFVTDKMPQNFRYIALICAALPEAKIIHVDRDPVATCWSNFRQFFESRKLGYCYSLDDVVTYYGLHEDLMQHWASEYAPGIHRMNYEALTQDPECLTRELLANLALDWEDACLSPQENARAVATASQQQVRRPVYTGSSEAWRKYEPFIGKAFEPLRSAGKRSG